MTEAITVCLSACFLFLLLLSTDIWFSTSLLGLPSDGAPDEDPSDANDSSKTKSKDKSAKTRPKDYRGTRKPSK